MVDDACMLARLTLPDTIMLLNVGDKGPSRADKNFPCSRGNGERAGVLADSTHRPPWS